MMKTLNSQIYTPDNAGRRTNSATHEHVHVREESNFDLIIVGGGIYGIMLALEAVRRDLKPLLLERDEFASATSRNSLKIVHGGLRYLQSADLKRHFQSVRERRWFLKYFPEYVKPLPCLMPLYNKGLKRRAMMAAAMKVNDMLSQNRNEGLTADQVLPDGRLLGAKDVGHIFPQVDNEGLKGGAVWSDAVMTDDRLLARAALAWATAKGAVAIEGMDVYQLQIEAGRVEGVRARAKGDKSYQFFGSQFVINATGPWAASFARQYDKNGGSFFAPSLAWNILFRRPALSDHALALTARHHATRTYFAVPRQGQLMIGTGHAPWQGSPDDPQLTDQQIDRFLSELNRIVPTLNLGPGDIEQKFVGLLPAQQLGSDVPSRKPAIVDHGAQGGPAGLHSVSGVKFTTARDVADKTLSRIFKRAKPKPYDDLFESTVAHGPAQIVNFNSA